MNMCGVMLVGPTSSGKSAAFKVLIDVMKLNKCKVFPFYIDPKAITRKELYGNFDETTNVFEDGILTNAIRNILNKMEENKNPDY